MDVKSNPQVMPKTLADLIAHETPKDYRPPVSNPNDYEVYPEITDETDLKRNPYSRV